MELRSCLRWCTWLDCLAFGLAFAAALASAIGFDLDFEGGTDVAAAFELTSWAAADADLVSIVAASGDGCDNNGWDDGGTSDANAHMSSREKAGAFNEGEDDEEDDEDGNAGDAGAEPADGRSNEDDDEETDDDDDGEDPLEPPDDGLIPSDLSFPPASGDTR